MLFGGCFGALFIIFRAEDKFVIEEVVQNHGDKSGEAENAGGFDKVVVEGETNGTRDVVSKFVEGCNEAKKPSEEWADGKCGEEVPGKEFDNAGFAGVAFFPGDFGMSDISNDGCNEGRNKS